MLTFKTPHLYIIRPALFYGAILLGHVANSRNKLQRFQNIIIRLNIGKGFDTSNKPLDVQLALNDNNQRLSRLAE